MTTLEHLRTKLKTLLPVIYGLSVAVGGAQDLAVFKVPDSTRPFLFNLTPPSFDPAPSANTNSTKQGVEGLMTVMAKRFETERRAGPTRAGVVAIRFYDVIVCQANRSQEEGAGSPVFSTDAFTVEYPGDARILLHGRSVLLANLSEKTFDPPKTFNTYTGDEAIRKLKEMGLDPPEDMDWKKATNGASRQPAGAANGSQPIRSQTNRTPSRL